MFIYLPIFLLFWLLYDYHFLNATYIKILFYNGIEFVLFCKKLFHKGRGYLTLHINNFFFIEPKCVSIVNENGKILNTLSINGFSNFINNNRQNNENKYSIFYDWNTLDNSTFNSFMLRFENLNDVHEDFNLSIIKFLVPTINIKDSNNCVIKKFDLTNIFNDVNFYITNNILFDKIFVNWFLSNYYNFELNESTYDVTFIDNKMDPIKLNDSQGIVIDYDFYLIINN